MQSYCTINIWCSISKFWISSDMMMNTKYSDENDVVVVRTPWNWVVLRTHDIVTFGVYIGLAGLLVVILLWVLFTKCHLR